METAPVKCRTFISHEGEAESEIEASINETGNVEIYTHVGDGVAVIELGIVNAADLAKRIVGLTNLMAIQAKEVGNA